MNEQRVSDISCGLFWLKRVDFKKGNEQQGTTRNTGSSHIGESLKCQADIFIFDPYQLEQSWKPMEVFEQLRDMGRETL